MDISGEERAALVEQISGDDWRTSVRALERLASYLELSPPRADACEVEAALLDALRSPSWRIRRAAVVALRNASPNAFREALVVGLSDANTYVNGAAKSVRAERDLSSSVSLFRPTDEKELRKRLSAFESRFGRSARTEAVRLAEAFAGSLFQQVHHELSRVLTSASLAVERADDVSRDLLSKPEALSQAASRLGRLGSMLDAARDVTAPYYPTLDDVDLRETIEASFSVALDSAPAGGRLVGILGDGRVHADSQRLRSAFENIFKNAIESYGTGSDRPVHVEIHTTELVATVEVRDQGAGMTDEQVELFGTLYVSTKKGGSGVGLSMCRRIVEREHGGLISVQSAPGKGTTVQVMLPTRKGRLP